MTLSQLRNVVLLVGAGLLAAFALAAGASAMSLATASSPDGGHEPAAGRAPSGTNVSGVLTTSTTWTLAGSPYVVGGNVTVLPTVTLTISPGVEVDFAQSTELIVNGTLNATGTASGPITFTGTTRQAGWWGSILLQGTPAAPISGSVLSYVTIEDAGSCSGCAGLYLTHAYASLSNSTVRDSGKDGVTGDTGGVADLTNDTFSGNLGYAVRFIDGSVNPLLANLSATGNTHDAIGWGNGTLTGAHRFPALGIPYVMYYNGVTIAPSSTLVISPGVEIDFNQNAGININGTLDAVGTPAKPITFTGTSKTPGWWNGLIFQGTAGAPLNDSALSYVTLEYGGYYKSGSIFVQYTTLPVDHATIRNGATDGVLGSDRGSADLTNISFLNNQGYAVKFQDGSINPLLDTLSATGNMTDAIAWGNGTLTGTHRFPALGMPYVMYYNGVTVAPGHTRIISHGVEIDFNQNAGININGTLTALGTAANPITFTGTSKSPGWWNGLIFQGTALAPLSDSALSHVTLEYGGYYHSGSVFVQYATVPVSNAIIRNGATDGVLGSDRGSADLTNVSFVNNQGYAVKFQDGSVNPLLSNLSAAGNTSNAIAWGNGTLSGVHTWPNFNMPYVLYYNGVTLAPSSTLIISPGVEVDFNQAASLQVYGTLSAIGTAANPITFTGMTKSPGYWNGIQLRGTPLAPIAGSTLSYVTIEDSGYNTTPDLYAYYAQFTLSNSTIRNSSSDGIKIDAGSTGSTIEQDQIVGNAGYGLRNLTPARTVMAANNWWGAASGPNVDGNCNAGGTGSRVSAGVAFKPFLTDPNGTPDLISPSDARIIQLTPWRWFIPADAVSRAWITATLTDGAGNPLAGRTVTLASTLGTVVDGGVTDLNGQTLAYVRSGTPGNADVTASLSLSDACELARTPVSQLTFTPVGAGGDLMPDSRAPYLNDGIQVSPLPIMLAVPTTVSVTLVNPNAFTITVNGTFGFAQTSVGLTFGPLGSVTNVVIPPNGRKSVSVLWTPLVSGHYCIQFQYSYLTSAASAPSLQLKEFQEQRNVDVRPAPFMGPNDKQSLKKAQIATNGLGDMSDALTELTDGASYIGGYIPGFLFGYILDSNYNKATQISKNLVGGDPPRQDYTTLAYPEQFSFTPLQPGPTIPLTRATVLNNYMAAVMKMVEMGDAASISLDRYSGAAQAHDLQWQSLQASAMFYYNVQFGLALIDASAALDAHIQQLQSEGLDGYLSAAQYQAFQQQLASQGWPAEYKQAAYMVGLTDADLDQIKQDVLAQDPNVMAQGSLVQKLTAMSSAWRQAGMRLVFPPAIGVTISAGRAALQPSATDQNSLARIYTTYYPVTIGNPLTQTATINLSLRRIDVPSDWQITAPTAVTLPAGGQTTITVTVQAGTAVVQSTMPSVAIEGYANNNLIGGLVLEVDVPHWALFRSQRLFLPEIVR